MLGWIWFAPGELTEIVSKVRQRKFGYEAGWEATVLAALAFGVIFAFYYGFWFGVLMLWFCKLAIQALNSKKFFDRLP